VRSNLGIIVGARPVAFAWVNQLAQFNGLVGAGGVDAVGCLAVQPVVCAAQPQAFGADHANVVGCKGLAQCAGVKFFHAVIRQVRQALVAEIIRIARFGKPFRQLCRIGKDGDLDFVDDGAEIGLEAGVQDFAKMLQVKPFIGCAIRDTDPGNIPLPDVLDTRSAVDEVMDLALKHRFEIFLHLPPSHLHHNPHIHIALGRNFVKCRPDNFHLAVYHLFQRRHVQVFKTARIFTAKFDAHIRLAHHLAFKR